MIITRLRGQMYVNFVRLR